MSKPVTFTKQARKALLRMPANTAKRIRAKIDQLSNDPTSLANNITELKGSPYMRLRVGDWRVIFQDGLVIAIIEIGPRGGIYD